MLSCAGTAYSIISWGCHPKPAILFVLTQKVFKKVKAYDAFTTNY
jgi:hypothetical protein